MDTKPTFSRSGYLRRIAMSYRTSLFIVVEGKNHDRYFVDRLCRNNLKVRKKGFEVKMVQQIRQSDGIVSGGKAAVLSFYDYCRRANKLTQKNSGGIRNICFFVDRDGQHITGGMRRSPHVLYTTLADVEAHIFFDSDETEAIGAAASLDHVTAENVTKHIGDWKRVLADVWRPWIEECYVAEATKARCQAGFGPAVSQVHKGKDNRILDSTALAGAQQAIADTTLLSDPEYQIKRSKVLGKIERVYSANKQSTLLKGKWLPSQVYYCVEEYFDAVGWPDGWNKRSFKANIAHCYLCNVNFSSRSLETIYAKLEPLAS